MTKPGLQKSRFAILRSWPSVQLSPKFQRTTGSPEMVTACGDVGSLKIKSGEWRLCVEASRTNATGFTLKTRSSPQLAFGHPKWVPANRVPCGCYTYDCPFGASRTSSTPPNANRFLFWSRLNIAPKGNQSVPGPQRGKYKDPGNRIQKSAESGFQVEEVIPRSGYPKH